MYSSKVVRTVKVTLLSRVEEYKLVCVVQEGRMTWNVSNSGK